MKAPRIKVLLFGTGRGGRNGFRHVRNQYKVVGFCDNNPEKQGTLFCGLPVYAPSALSNVEFDRILVCSMYRKEIADQLTHQLGYAPEQIDMMDPDVLIYGEGLWARCLVAAAILAGVGYGLWRLAVR